jgi:hypothetical protein
MAGRKANGEKATPMTIGTTSNMRSLSPRETEFKGGADFRQWPQASMAQFPEPLTPNTSRSVFRKSVRNRLARVERCGAFADEYHHIRQLDDA